MRILFFECLRWLIRLIWFHTLWQARHPIIKLFEIIQILVRFSVITENFYHIGFLITNFMQVNTSQFCFLQGLEVRLSQFLLKNGRQFFEFLKVYIFNISSDSFRQGFLNLLTKSQFMVFHDSAEQVIKLDKFISKYAFVDNELFP